MCLVSLHGSKFDFIAAIDVAINQSAEAVTDRGTCCNCNLHQTGRQATQKMFSSLQMRLKRHSVSFNLSIDIGLIYWQMYKFAEAVLECKGARSHSPELSISLPECAPSPEGRICLRWASGTTIWAGRKCTPLQLHLLLPFLLRLHDRCLFSCLTRVAVTCQQHYQSLLREGRTTVRTNSRSFLYLFPFHQKWCKEWRRQSCLIRELSF